MYGRFVKRGLDILLALAAIVVLLPLLLKKKMNLMLSWLKQALTKSTLLKKSELLPNWA